MGFIFNEKKFREESEAFYQTYPADVSNLEAELDGRYQTTGPVSALIQKKWTYDIISHKCPVKVFRYCPFYSEIVTGRERNSIASAFPPIKGLGSWTLRSHYPIEEFDDWRKPYVESDLIFADMMVDHSHHYANVETVMKKGFKGIKEEALIQTDKDQYEKEFLEAVISACDAAMLLGDRFAEEARRLADVEQEGDIKEQLVKMAETAHKIPRYPAETFYEALCSLWFTRELATSLDGSGFAVMGHYDRLLYPFYERDIKEGRLSRDEAQNLMDCMILITDARWEHNENTSGTNASLVIGGCNAKGELIFNDVTELILNSYIKYPVASPKLQARISATHPRKYKEMLGKIAALGRNALSILNDDVLIEAHHRMGKRLEDCRLYLAGGCQEPVLSEECNSRAFMYINLPQLMNGMFFPQELDFWTGEDIRPRPLDNCKNFEQFYENVIYNFSRFVFACAGHYNHFENIWAKVNPMPLFSSMFAECIENKRDVSAGGARYNSSSFSLVGIGTFIDSLFAVKQAVYEEKNIKMEEMVSLLRDDFAGNEEKRLYLMNKVSKYGQDNPELSMFAARVFEDLAQHSSGMPNARGGYYEASLFAFFFYDTMRKNTWATPDGRHKGKRVSRGCNPGESTENIDIATLLQSLRGIDFKDYPGCGVTYMEMPISKDKLNIETFVDILDGFVQCGGNAMDFDVVDKDALLEAKKYPDSYRNLIVRVCGYSAPFISLSEELQDEVIERALRAN